MNFGRAEIEKGAFEMAQSFNVSIDADEQPQFKVAVVQMDSGANKEDNLRAMAEYIDEAAAARAKVICFPEGANQIAVPVEPFEFECIPGNTTNLLAQKAYNYNVYIHGGSIHEHIEGDDRAYNTSIIMSPDDEVIARYRKLHTFDAVLSDGTTSEESTRILPGDDVVVVPTPFGRWGCSTCYDLRFPELFRMMALLGAQVIFVPANFTRTTGHDHWETLLRARAIENGCYIVAADQCGEKPEFVAYGHSMIIDPWGEVLAEASQDEPEIIYADIDLARVQEVREQLPCLVNRRADVYGSFGLDDS